MNICIVGSNGFVGLTLSMALCEKGFKVYGIDKNKTAWDQIKELDTPFHEEGLKDLIKKHYDINFFDYEEKQNEIDAYIITVGSPLDENKNPNFEYIKDACELVDPEKLVILRSTVAVGITEKLIEEFGLKYVAYCPERTSEGEAIKELFELPQLIASNNNAAFHQASKIFIHLSPEIIRADIKEVELAKLLCNVSRDAYFAIGNVLSEICQKHGADYNKVREIATRNYKRGNIARCDLVGGSCLEKDAYLLTNNNLIMALRQYNENMVNDIFKWVQSKVNRQDTIIMSGLAFKGQPDNSDTRGALQIELLRLLRQDGYVVQTHDFIINPVNLYDLCKDAKLLLIMNNKKGYTELDLSRIRCDIFDASDVLKSDKTYTLGNYLI